MYQQVFGFESSTTADIEIYGEYIVNIWITPQILVRRNQNDINT